MADIIITKKNNRYLKIQASPDIMMDMQETFSFFTKGYKFHPSFKARLWDGRIRLLNYRTGEIYSGLLSDIKKFAEESGYSISMEHSDYYGYPGETVDLTFDTFQEFVDGLDIRSDGEKITPYDYQIEAAYTAINERGALLLSPTASGKSLVIYMMIRWYMVNRDKKALIIVPTTGLLAQMYNDFDDYSSHDEWDVEDHMHKIVPGADKKTDKTISVSCWQSLFKLKGDFLSQYGMIIGDEAHGFAAKSVMSMMDKATETEFTIGTTGTLDGTKVHHMTMTGIFGKVKNVISTKQLIDDGRVSDVTPYVVTLKYNETERKSFPKKSYHEEIKFIEEHVRRNRFVRNLALKQDGITLVLFEHKAHGKILYEMIKENAHDSQTIYHVDGDVKAAERERIRKSANTKKGCIIVASYKTFSTGINIKNIRSIITAGPIGKSVIRVLQSLGRGLRLSDDGKGLLWFDLVDDLHWRSKKNYSLKHAADRIEIYAKQKFKYKIVEAIIS